MARKRSIEQIKQSMVEEYKRRCKEQGVDLPDDVVRMEVERFTKGIEQAWHWLREHPGLIRWPDFTKAQHPLKVHKRSEKKFSVDVRPDEDTDYAMPPGGMTS